MSKAAAAQAPGKMGQNEPPPARAEGTKDKAAEKPTLIVFDMAPEKGVDKSEANLLTELVIDRASKLRKYDVIGQKDLDKMLSWEQNKQLSGCTDTSCLVQIAGAMGARYYVEGSVGLFGDFYIITLKLMDVTSVRIVERSTERVKKDENEVIKALDRMVDSVIGLKEAEQPKKEVPAPAPAVAPEKKKAAAVPPVPAQVAAPEKKEAIETVEAKAAAGGGYRLLGKIGLFSGIGVAAAGGAFTYLASKAAGDYEKSSDPRKMQDLRDSIGLYNKIAVAAYATGGVLAAGGAALWILSPDQGTQKSVSLAPWADERGCYFVLEGGF